MTLIKELEAYVFSRQIHIKSAVLGIIDILYPVPLEDIRKKDIKRIPQGEKKLGPKIWSDLQKKINNPFERKKYLNRKGKSISKRHFYRILEDLHNMGAVDRWTKRYRKKDRVPPRSYPKQRGAKPYYFQVSKDLDMRYFDFFQFDIKYHKMETDALLQYIHQMDTLFGHGGSIVVLCKDADLGIFEDSERGIVGLDLLSKGMETLEDLFKEYRVGEFWDPPVFIAAGLGYGMQEDNPIPPEEDIHVIFHKKMDTITKEVDKLVEEIKEAELED